MNQERPLFAIAHDIKRYWPNVNYAAKPYLDTMSKMNSVNDKFYADDGRTVVLYFLANAQSFRGEDAKRIKAELKRMVA